MISKEDYEGHDCHNIDCFTNSDPSKNIFDDNTFLRYIDDDDYCCLHDEESELYASFSKWTDDFWGYTHENADDLGGFWSLHLS